MKNTVSLKEQVLSLQQMAHLKKLGVEVEKPSHWWVSMSKDTRGNDIKKRHWFVSLDDSAQHCGFMKWEFIPTLTLQEILKLLPRYINFPTFCDRGYLLIDYRGGTIGYQDEEGNEFNFSFLDKNGYNLLLGAYKLLCWLAENKFL